MIKIPLHLKGPLAGGEYTACGVAFDAYNTGDAEEPILVAMPGQVATCVECRRVVDFYKAIRGYREP